MRSFCQPCQRPLRNGWEQQQRQQGPQLLQQYPAPCRRQRSIQCSSTQHQDLYVVLGVSYDADASDIKAAFRTKAKQLHPDVNKAADAETAFRLLKRAHEVLSDGMLRAAHDSELREQLPEASAALRARDPRFARFERWRSEIMPDLNLQLDVWTQEVMGILDAADAALSRQEQEFRWAMVQAAPPASNAASVNALNNSGSSSSSSSNGSSRQHIQGVVNSMRGTLTDAAANVQRLYDKRYDQMQTRFPGYPDIVWYDRWLEVGDSWLDGSERLVKKWQPRITAAAQWLPAGACAAPQ